MKKLSNPTIKRITAAAFLLSSLFILTGCEELMDLENFLLDNLAGQDSVDRPPAVLSPWSQLSSDTRVSLDLVRVPRDFTGEKGNNPGNLANGGLVCHDGSRTYYLDSSGLRSINDGSDSSMLVSSVHHANLNYDKGKTFGSIMDGSHANTLTNAVSNFTGSEFTDISPYSNISLIAGNAWNVTVIDGNIYYIDSVGIRTVSVDKPEDFKWLVSGEIRWLTVYQDTLYYTDARHNHSLFAMPIEGGESELLTNDRCFMPIAYPDGIYFINFSDGQRVTKLWLEDGEAKTQQITQYGVSSFVIADGWLYGTDDNHAPFAMDMAKSTPVSMGDFPAVNVFVTYDSVYYRVPDSTGGSDGSASAGSRDNPGGEDLDNLGIRDGEWNPGTAPDYPGDLDWTPDVEKDFTLLSGRYEIIAEITVGGLVIPFEISGNYLDLMFYSDGTGYFDSSINNNDDNPFLGSGEVALFEYAFRDSILYMRDPRNRTGERSNMNDVDYYVYIQNGVIHMRGYTIQPGGIGYRITLVKLR